MTEISAERAAHVLQAFVSPAYPTGAFAYSHGLESAIQRGEVDDPASLERWLGDVIAHGTGRGDAILLAAAMRPDADLDALSALAEALATSRERHVETMAQGAAFATVTAAVHGTDATPRPFPIAVGAAARVLGLAPAAVVPAILHAFTANLLSAAQRALPLGQTAAQQRLVALFPLIERTAAEALSAPLDALGQASLAADLAAMHHEGLEPRIFRT